MLFRKTIAFIAKKVYSEDYTLLKLALLQTYSKIEIKCLRKNSILLERFLISGEDHRFKYHSGFDLIAITRAIRNKYLSGKTEGASTIEQQLVRVLLNDYSKTYKRKIKEIFLATTLADIMPRNEIPMLYLHVAYYGPNIIGLSMITIKLNIPDLHNISENSAAEIIARIKYPESLYENKNRSFQIENRKKHLLKLYRKHKDLKLFNPYSVNRT